MEKKKNNAIEKVENTEKEIKNNKNKAKNNSKGKVKNSKASDKKPVSKTKAKKLEINSVLRFQRIAFKFWTISIR